jgi:hypothetical protein
MLTWGEKSREEELTTTDHSMVEQARPYEGAANGGGFLPVLINGTERKGQ